MADTIKDRFNQLLAAMAQGKPTQKLSPKSQTSGQYFQPQFSHY